MSLLLNKIARPSGEIIDCATLDETATNYGHGERAFIGLIDPTHDELTQLTQIFDLHELAVEDSEHGHQRAKLDRYGDTYFLVLRPTVYLDETEEIRFGETHMFVSDNFVLWLVKDALRSETSTRASMQKAFKETITEEGTPPASMVFLYRMLDTTVDGYFPVIEGLENDGDEIEDTLFADRSEASEISQRIYGLLNEVSDFKRAVKPVASMLDLLMGRLRIATGKDEERVELIRRFRDVHDHVLHVNDRVDDLRASLENALAVNSTIVAERQNDDMKRISAWAAILVSPTVIGSIYGMNFDEMPELHWDWAYPASLGLMLFVSLMLWLIFKKKEWL